MTSIFNYAIAAAVRGVSLLAVLAVALVYADYVTTPAKQVSRTGNGCPFIIEQGLTCSQSCDKGIPNYASKFNLK